MYGFRIRMNQTKNLGSQQGNRIMHIYTSYRMMQEEVRDSKGRIIRPAMERTDPLFRELCISIGAPRTYGPDRPIDVSTMMSLNRDDLRDPLWCLGCVYPEQEVSASRIARRVAILAYEIASGRYQSYQNKLLERAMRSANEYVHGSSDIDSLSKYRRKLWNASSTIKEPHKYLFLIAWVACSAPDRIARIVHALPDAVKRSIPGEELSRRKVVRSGVLAETEMKEFLKRALSYDVSGSEPGPGEMSINLPPDLLRIGA